MKKNKNILILTPVYEDADTFYILAKHISKILKTFEIIAVEDGSLNNTIDLKKIPKNTKTTVVKLKRNVGHQQAIAIGLCFIYTKFKDSHDVVIMDSDGEDKPNSINELLNHLSDKNIDVVVASRKSRIESFVFKFFYQIYKLIFKILTGRFINFGNFMAIKGSSIERLLSYHQLSTHIASTVLLSKLRIFNLPIDRGSRYLGKSKMNFSALVLHGFHALMNFSDNVLVRLGLISIFSLLAILIIIFLIIFLKAIGMATPGWFSLALGLLTILLIQIGAFVLIFLIVSGKNKDSNDLVDTLIQTIKQYETNI